ncbi:MAG: nucleotide exchange factor GrpE [Micromonosporaceae bacterium]
MGVQSDSGSGAAKAPADRDQADEPAGHTVLLAELGALRDAVKLLSDREHERAQHREAVIDRLHAENQALRRNELETMLEPVRMGLYRLYDLARREGERFSGSQPPAAEHAGPLLSAIAEEVAEVLARTGVEPYAADPGEPYDSARHRPMETADVTDPALDGAVTRTLGTGFVHGEKVVRRADVEVGQLVKPKRTRTPGKATGPGKAASKAATPKASPKAASKAAKSADRQRKQ